MAKIIDELCKWFRNNDFDIEKNSNIKLVDSNNIEEGRCIISCKNLKPNETIVEIPLKFIITYRFALKNDEFKKFFEWSFNLNDNLKKSNLSRLDALYLYLLNDYLNKDSYLYPFVNSMPKSYDTPAFFDDKLVQLLPSYIKDIVEKRKLKLLNNYENISNLLNLYVKENNDSSLKHLQQSFTYDLFRWIFFSVYTRCFHFKEDDIKDELDMEYINRIFGKLNYHINEYIDKEGHDDVNNSLCCLMPYLDFMNHSTNSNTFAEYDKEKRVYILKTQELEYDGDDEDETNETGKLNSIRIKEGEQIYVTYGAHDNKSLFLDYGFVLDDNMYDCIRFEKCDFYELFNDKEKFDEYWATVIDHKLIQDLTCTQVQGPSWSLTKALDYLCYYNKLSNESKNNKKVKRVHLNSGASVKFMKEVKNVYENLLNKYGNQLKKAIEDLKEYKSKNFENIKNQYHFDLSIKFCELHFKIVDTNLSMLNDEDTWNSLFD